MINIVKDKLGMNSSTKVKAFQKSSVTPPKHPQHHREMIQTFYLYL